MSRPNAYSVLLGTAAVAGAVLVVALALENRRLEGRVADLAARLRDPYPGFVVPPTRVMTMSGDSLAIGDAPPGGFELLFVFATACDACTASVPAWKVLSAEVRNDPKIDVVGLSVDRAETTQQYVADNGFDFPVATFTDRRMRALYRARDVPQVLLLDAVGRVRYVRFGPLTARAAVDSIRTALDAVVGATAVAVEAEGAASDAMDTGSQAPR